MGKRAFPPLPTHPQLVAVYPALLREGLYLIGFKTCIFMLRARDSLTRYVSWLVRPSQFAFSAFAGIFSITAPALTLG